MSTLLVDDKHLMASVDVNLAKYHTITVDDAPYLLYRSRWSWLQLKSLVNLCYVVMQYHFITKEAISW